jgi:uncharacterized OsmC-like protein
MSEERSFRVEVEREEGFVFRADFGLDGVGPLVMDEPEPLGAESGPNASKVLAAAVGNCLSASLLFCLRKSRVDVSGMRAAVDGVSARNEGGRWRVRELNVVISPDVAEEDRGKLDRCVELFEDFCIVSQSVREGIPINVVVRG